MEEGWGFKALAISDLIYNDIVANYLII